MKDSLQQHDKFTSDDVEIMSKQTVFKGSSKWFSIASSIDCLKVVGVP